MSGIKMLKSLLLNCVLCFFQQPFRHQRRLASMLWTVFLFLTSGRGQRQLENVLSRTGALDMLHKEVKEEKENTDQKIAMNWKIFHLNISNSQQAQTQCNESKLKNLLSLREGFKSWLILSVETMELDHDLETAVGGLKS